MGDAFLAFEPVFPATWRLPTGYTVEGISDEEGVFFYWTRWEGGSPVEFGSNEPNKRKCRKEAWQHSRVVQPLSGQSGNGKPQ